VGASGCVVVPAGSGERGVTGLEYFAGISRGNAGSSKLCLQVVKFPPGARAKAHLHEGSESALYVLSGRVGMWHGDGLAEYLETGPGDFLFVPAGVPHLPFNTSETEAAEAIVARSDPNEQESVVPLP
jgi:uncharacterized RmlC-like cupin family protein